MTEQEALAIARAFLATIFLVAGAAKLFVPPARLAEAMPFVRDVRPAALRTIGVVELAAVAGLVVPWATGRFGPLTALAALGLAGVMLGAMATHVRRGEYLNMGANLALLALALFVAWGHWPG